MSVGSNGSERSIFYDIETIVRGDAKAYITTKEFEPDARLKDPEKVKASIEEKRQKAIAEGSLRWWYGQIVSIAWITEERDERVEYGMDERKVLCSFFDAIEHMWGIYPFSLVGKNSAGFDNGYLIGRALALGVGVPRALRVRGTITDVDQLFGFKSGAAGHGKLADYAFGVGMKKTADGSEVAEMVAKGEWEKLSQYNLQDTRIVAEMMKRYSKPYTIGEVNHVIF